MKVDYEHGDAIEDLIKAREAVDGDEVFFQFVSFSMFRSVHISVVIRIS